jgi:antitoxin MazE
MTKPDTGFSLGSVKGACTPLDALISGINAANVHEEVGFGSPAGNEAL